MEIELVDANQFLVSVYNSNLNTLLGDSDYCSFDNHTRNTKEEH